MELFTNYVAAPGSIAHLDGASDGESCGRQSQTPVSQQQPLDSSASPLKAPSETEKQARDANVDGGLQEHKHLDTHNSPQTVQEAQITDERQYDDTMHLFPSHTIDVQTSEPRSEHLHAFNPTQMPSGPLATTGEIEVKSEPEINDHDLFATFIREDSHDNDSEEFRDTKRASNGVSGLVDQEPIRASIRSEPDIGGQSNTNLSERVDSAVRADHNTPTAHVAAPRPEYPSQNDKHCSGADSSETEAFPKRVLQMTPESHDKASTAWFTPLGSSSTAAGRDYITELSREQWVQELIQQSIDAETSSLFKGHQTFADPSINSQRYGSVETVTLRGNMDSRAAMFHRPLPTSSHFDHVKGQQTTALSTFTGHTNLHSSNPTQHFSTSQPRINNPYDGRLPHQFLHSHPPHAHPFAQLIPSGNGAGLQMSTADWQVGNAFTSGPSDPHNTELEEGDVEMSEQSRLLMIDQSSGNLAIPADSVIGAPEDLEDPSDNDASDAEPISWKLPSFEVTYHGPEKANDNHTAAVSIPNLVREHVALTDDHHRQEMQLFLEVFLPAQRALQTPDPEPAHAVINFHSISVMVLEAFVQWEIGDELGRGYGFHGGNTAMRPLPQGKEEDEPERIRSATDADVDEIFFAVVDRWRAGMLSDKGTLKLIRGCQEFCDIALDVIHFIKEHGILSPEEKKRKERSDKGSVRGPKGGAQEESESKRKADAGKVTNVPSRKKPKTEDKKGKKPVAKPKKKAKPSIQVTRTK